MTTNYRVSQRDREHILDKLADQPRGVVLTPDGKSVQWGRHHTLRAELLPNGKVRFMVARRRKRGAPEDVA